MLTRLEETGVVAVGESRCRARSPSRIFAVERIIAVEAKVSATRRALEQAGANIWYSSESHALVPRSRAGERMKDVASALGVGVIGFEHDRVAQVYERRRTRSCAGTESWWRGSTTGARIGGQDAHRRRKKSDSSYSRSRARTQVGATHGFRAP